MPIQPFDGMGIGVSRDSPRWSLPPNVWSDVRNVRGTDGGTEKATGAEEIIRWNTGGSVIHRMIEVVNKLSNRFLVIATNTEVFVTNGFSVGIVGSALGLRFMSQFQGYVILTSGSSTGIPHSWDSLEAFTPNQLITLPNWPDDLAASLIRPFRNYLFALRAREGALPGTFSSSDPFTGRLIRWSSSSTPHNLPSSWDYTDPTNDAGRVEFGATTDRIVDLLELRDKGVLYKTDHTWVIEYVGGLDAPFAFRPAFSEIGMLTEHCALSHQGRHIVLTQHDLVIHDLNSAESLVNQVMRRWLFSNISTDLWSLTYLSADHRNREIWVCFPQQGSTAPDMALIYNYMDGTLTIREFPFGIPHMTAALLTNNPDRTDLFNADTGAFDQGGVAPTGGSLYWADDQPTFRRLLRSDIGYAVDGTAIVSSWHREALPLKQTVQQLVTVQRVYPKVEGVSGDTLDVRIGTRYKLEEDVTWSDYQTFTVGVDTFVNFREQGRVIDIEFRHTTANPLRMFGFDIDYFPSGQH